MSELNKPAWPQTPDGTTDWETVFEDPQGGLIPLISKAQSRQALRECARVVIQQLFTRKGDADDVARFTEQLDEALSDIDDEEDLGTVLASVILLLRNIKDERTEKARLYVARKKARERARERRAEKEYKAKRTASVMAFILRITDPKVAIALFVLLTALTGGIYYVTGMFAPPPPPPVAATGEAGAPNGTSQDVQSGQNAQPADAQGQSPSATAKADGQQASSQASNTKPGGAKALPARPVLPRIIVLRPFSWPSFGGSTRRTLTYYATLIYPTDAPKATATICRRYPQVVDAIYRSFNAVVPDGNVNEKSLAEIAMVAVKAINDEVGGLYVAKTELIRYGNPRFRTSNRHTCRLIRRPIPPIPKKADGTEKTAAKPADAPRAPSALPADTSGSRG